MLAILYFIVIISGAMGKQQTTKARTRKRNGWHGKRNEEQLLYLVLPRKFLDDSDYGAFHIYAMIQIDCDKDESMISLTLFIIVTFW